MRTFAIRETDFGLDVIDGHGTRWAGFEKGDRDAASLAQYFRDMAERAYGFGAEDAGDGKDRDLAIRPSRTADGTPVWAVLVEGDGKRSLGTEVRSRLQMGPPSRIRRLLEMSRDVYAVAQADHHMAPVPTM